MKGFLERVNLDLVERPTFSKIRAVTLDPLTALILGVFFVLTFLFYTTNFRRELENFFHDTRIWLMPNAPTSDSIIVVEIDEASISELEKTALRHRHDANQKPYLSVQSLTLASGILANTESSAIALLLPDHAIAADDPDLTEVVNIARFDPRFILGLSGYHQAIPNLSKLPAVFEKIDSQIAATETFRSRSNAIVRTMPYLSYRGLRETANLPATVARILDSNFAMQGGNYIIKYHPPSHYRRIKIEDLIKAPQQYMDQFKGKVALLGYSVPRSTGIQTTEQSFANTPLTGYAPTNLSGVSTMWLMADAIENLVLDESIRVGSGFITVLQTLAVAAICGFSWTMGSMSAAAVTALTWICLLFVHALLYRWFSLSIPLADTFLATSFVSMVGASRTLKHDLKFMAEQEVTTDAKLELVRFQSHFLSGFATWIITAADRISHLVRSEQKNHTNDSKITELFSRVFLATSDLTEYASGIAQLSHTDANQDKNISIATFDLEATLTVILRRFETKAASRKLTLSVHIDPNAKMMHSNEQFIDAIIYNLVSNAVKYARPATQVLIHISKTTSGATSISVLDQGPGIQEEFRERIFERFYRIHDERLYDAKGSGVGLYLCRYFAEALGGQIELSSEVGKGSEFRAVIP